MFKNWILFHWTHEHKIPFTSNDDRISEDTSVAVASTDYRFHFLLDFPNLEQAVFWINCFLTENQNFPSTPCFLTVPNKECLDSAKNSADSIHHYEPKNTTSVGPHSHCTYTLTTGQSFICGEVKDNYHTDFSEYQMIKTKFKTLEIIWTRGSNLAFSDILSRSLTVEDNRTPKYNTRNNLEIRNSTMNVAIQYLSNPTRWWFQGQLQRFICNPLSRRKRQKISSIARWWWFFEVEESQQRVSNINFTIRSRLFSDGQHN